MKMKGFRGDALIAGGSRGVGQSSRKRKFGFSSNSLRSGPPKLKKKQLRTQLKNSFVEFTLARRKSRIFAWPRFVARMFAGLMSR